MMVGDVPLKRHPPAVNGEAWKEVCCLPPNGVLYENEIVPPTPSTPTTPTAKAPKPSKQAASQERAGQTAKSD
jgi:hypothetical protein